MLNYNLEGKIANGRVTVYATVHPYLEHLMLPLLVFLPWQAPRPFPTLCSILIVGTYQLSKHMVYRRYVISLTTTCNWKLERTNTMIKVTQLNIQNDSRLVG